MSHCTERQHAPRTLADTSAGILAERGANTVTFMVHCVSCHGNFGPYATLAAAQAVGRKCADCDRHRIPEVTALAAS